MQLSPTINEIVFQRMDRSRRDNFYTKRLTKFHVGNIVQFKFNNLLRRGRITTAMNRNGVSFYHIESDAGTWYREIEQSDIIKLIEDGRG